MVNSYWEKNLPKTFQKPGPNASNHEVTEFMTNKYVHKKWANNDDWSHDPAWLYENKPKKYQKYLQYYKDNFINQQDAEPVSYKKNPSKRRDLDSSDDDMPVKAKKQTGFGMAPPPKSNLTQGRQFAQAPPVAQAQKKQEAPPVDLLNFDAAPATQQKDQNVLNDIFSAAPNTNNQDDGFADFQSSQPAMGG